MIPYFDEYNALRLWCAPNGPLPYPQVSTYEANGADHYDPVEVFEQNLDIDGDMWLPTIEHAVNHLREQAAFTFAGAVAGHHAYATGLARHYERTGDALSRDAVFLISLYAAGNSDQTPAWWAENPEGSREVAFSIRVKLAAESLGQPHRKRLEEHVNSALNHIDWWVAKKYGVVRSFMVGLTCQALIEYWDKYRDPRILPAVKKVADYLWKNLWYSGNLPVDHAAWANWPYGSFRYGDIETGDGSPDDIILPNELPPIESKINDLNPTAMSFKGENHLSTIDNYYKYAYVLLGEERRSISSYDGATRLFKFEFPDHGFPTAPQNGQSFKIIPGSDVSYPGWGIGWSGGNGAAPDLSLLIAPMYAWLFQQTKEQAYLNQFNEIMSGSIVRTGIGSQKVYNQSYIHSPKAIKWISDPIPTFTRVSIQIPEKTTRVNEISDLFRVSINGSTKEPLILNLIDNANGDFFPSKVVLTTNRPKATFRYRPKELGPKKISVNDQIIEYTPTGVADVATTYSVKIETPLIIGKRSRLTISLPENTVAPDDLVIVHVWPYLNATIHYQDNETPIGSYELPGWLSTENPVLHLSVIPLNDDEVYINFYNENNLRNPTPIREKPVRKKMLFLSHQEKFLCLC